MGLALVSTLSLSASTATGAAPPDPGPGLRFQAGPYMVTDALPSAVSGWTGSSQHQIIGARLPTAGPLIYQDLKMVEDKARTLLSTNKQFREDISPHNEKLNFEELVQAFDYVSGFNRVYSGTQTLQDMLDIADSELRQGFRALARLLRELEKQLGAKAADQPDIALPTTNEVFPTDEPTCGPDRQIERVKMFVDGASRGNPGPAAIGIIFTDMTGHVLWQVNRLLEEEATSNVAEYEALREGVLRALGQGWKKVHAFSDSELLVKQMLGQYKIKHPALQKAAAAVRRLIKQLDAFTIAHVKRDQNRLADRLATHALRAAKD